VCVCVCVCVSVCVCVCVCVCVTFTVILQVTSSFAYIVSGINAGLAESIFTGW